MAAVPTGGKTQESVRSKLGEELPLDFLNKITDGFSKDRYLGKGAFGTVYRGILEDKEVIAVKKLQENAPGTHDEKEYKKKVQNIMAHRHENIVKMIAYCHEKQRKLALIDGEYINVDVVETLLCYEYLPKGSLHDHLFARSISMDWSTRFKIIVGICQGLLFLHNLPHPIIHLDLKTQNILLGEGMVPKIADFGLSRLFGTDKTRTNTQNVVGSAGYMAPEYLYEGEISAQSDIYSLGVMIIEITTGEQISLDIDNKSAMSFIDRVKKVWTPQHITTKYSLLDSPHLQEVNKCISIGIKCVEIDPTIRPSINDIVDELEGRSASS